MVLVTMKRASDQESPRLRRTLIKISEAPTSLPSNSSEKYTPKTFRFKPLVFQELKNQPFYPGTTTQGNQAIF